MTESIPLPPLDRTVRLEPEAIASFRDKGHAVVRGLASAQELEPIRPLIEEKAVELRRSDR